MTQRAQTMVELATSALEQAQDCIRGETPEDMTQQEAREDTISKIREALRALAAPAPGGIEAREALEKIKEIVVGDKVPNWKDTDATYASRGKIADLCDITLQSQPVQPAGKGEQEPVAWRVDGNRNGKPQVWFYYKPEWPQMHAEHGDKVTPLYVRPDAPVGVRAALEHALVRFKCLEDHFKEIGDEALWAMSSVDADRMRKALAPVRGDSSDARADGGGE